MAAWQGRRALVTGHTGFKGGWLSWWLHAVGAHVFGYSLPPEEEPNLSSVAGVDQVVESTIGDVRDLPALSDCVVRSRAEVIFHLAAQSLVRRGHADPVATYSTNVMGTAHVLEAARRSETVKAVVVVTTDKCYENKEWHWGYREDDRLGGDDPYGSSKACAELIAHAYRHAFTGAGKRDLWIATARSGNTIGGGDWAPDRLIPDAVRAFCAGKPLLIRQPDAVRPWLHVLDSLGGYVLLAERLLNREPMSAQAFNFGPAAENLRSVREVADMVTALWGDGARHSQVATSALEETRILAIDSTKARAILGWRPRLDLRVALAMAVDWHKAYERGEEMGRVTHDQLCAYLDARGET